MKKFWIVFGIFAFLVGGLMTGLYLVVNSFEQQPDVAGGTLVWTVSGEYPERRDPSMVSLVAGDFPPTLTEVVFAIERAARDERITSLMLDIGYLSADWATVAELRAAVERFAATGKPVTAYLQQAGVREYALAVSADEVVLAPEAYLMVLGISAELAFMKDTLEKLGMKADFVHVGRYKSAPERMTRSEASDANREMMVQIIDTLYEQLVGMIAVDREVDNAEVKRWIDIGMFDANLALENGLVDRALVSEELRAEVIGSGAETQLDEYLLDRLDGVTSGTIAIVHVAGTIMPGESASSAFQGMIAGSATVVEQLADAGDDDAVDAIVLRVDSPGGSALASDLIWSEVVRARQNKPVIVSMGGYAASGGYYVSCAADSIFADPGTLTGSIGVYSGKMDRRGFYEKIGINREHIYRGENALLFGDEGGFSAGQREHLQGLLDNFYDRFVGKVAEGRGLSPEDVHEVAQGRVWTGEQAIEHGLVDDQGGLIRALKSAKRMAGIPEDARFAVRSYERQLTFIERMLLRSMPRYASAGLPESLERLSSMLEDDGVVAAAELMDGRPVTLMPFRIEFH